MYLAFAQHVNERQRGLRGLGAFRANERVRYLRGLGQDDAAPTVDALMALGVPRTQAENMVINYVTGSDLPIGWTPTTSAQVSPTATQQQGAPVFSQQWMDSEMIPGVKNKYLVLGTAGVFFVTALKKKKK